MHAELIRDSFARTSYPFRARNSVKGGQLTGGAESSALFLRFSTLADQLLRITIVLCSEIVTVSMTPSEEDVEAESLLESAEWSS